MIESGSNAFDVLPYLMRLRQICVDPSTFIEDYKGDSGKMYMLMELIEDYLSNNRRLLIFSQFVKALNIVETKLCEKNISYYMITGETTAKKEWK